MMNYSDVMLQAITLIWQVIINKQNPVDHVTVSSHI